MKEIEELKDRLRNEMVTRMDDSDIVDILTVLQRVEEEIDDWKQSHDKVARALEKSECEHKETLHVLHAFHGVNNIRSEVRWFSEQMENKLKENDHKGGWNHCGKYWLFERMKEETSELLQELSVFSNGAENEGMVIKECADIANFSMMIADKVREQSKERKLKKN